MAIQGVPQSNLAALNRVLSQIGKSLDEKSPAGLKVSEAEADKLIGAMDTLPAETKNLAQAALQFLVKDAFIELTDGGREKFAKAFNVPLPALTPKETAALAGHALARTTFSAVMKAAAKTPQADRKWMSTFIDGAKKELGTAAQQYLAAILQNASKEGVFKQDTEARRLSTKWVGQLNQDGEVTKTAERLQAGHDPKMSAFERALASGGFFEDILAAFMFAVVKDIKDEILEATKQLQNKEADEQKGKGRPFGRTSDLAERLINGGDAKGTPGAGGNGPVSRETLMKTRRDLESVVQSASTHYADDGFIDKAEAGKIAERLVKLDPPIARMLARALNDALRRSDLSMDAENLKPIVDWARGTLTAMGEPFETSKLPKGETPPASDGVAAGLRDSDRLENRLASFLVDAFLTPTAPVYGPMPEANRTVSEHVKKFNHVFEGVTESDATNLAAQVSPQQAAALKTANAAPSSNLPQLLGEVGLAPLMDLFKASADGPSLLSRPTRKAAAGKLIATLGSASPELKQTIRAYASQFPDPKLAKTPAEAEKLVADSLAALEKLVPQADAVLKGLPAEAKAELAKLGPDATPEQLQAVATKAAAQAAEAAAPAAGAEAPVVDDGAAATGGTEGKMMSRQELFEQLKRLQNHLSEIMQAISNILSSMNQNAMNSIRAIR